MFKSENPFQQLVDFTTGIKNVFNSEIKYDVFTKYIDDNKNIITINSRYASIISNVSNIFLVYCINDLEKIIEFLEPNMENIIKQETTKATYIFNDIDIKTSMIFSINFISPNQPILYDSLIGFYSNEVFYECYENLINNIYNYLTEISTCAHKNYSDYRILDAFYKYLFENENHFEFILKSDRKLLLKLLTLCYYNMSFKYLNKIMKKLNFNEEFIDCIHNHIVRNPIDDKEFKEYFNLE